MTCFGANALISIRTTNIKRVYIYIVKIMVGLDIMT